MALDPLAGIFRSNPETQLLGMRLIGGLSQQLDAVNQQQGPAPEPVPGNVNPFAAFASRFASSLSAQIGNPMAAQQNEQRLNAQAERVQAAENANVRRQELFDIQKRQERIALQEQISNIKLEQFKQAGMLDQAEREAKVQERLEKQKAKDRTQLATINSLAKIDSAKIAAAARRDVAQKRLDILNSPLSNKLSDKQKEALRLVRDRFNAAIRIHTAQIQTFDPNAQLSEEDINQLMEDALLEMDAIVGGLGATPAPKTKKAPPPATGGPSLDDFYQK